MLTTTGETVHSMAEYLSAVIGHGGRGDDQVGTVDDIGYHERFGRRVYWQDSQGFEDVETFEDDERAAWFMAGLWADMADMWVCDDCLTIEATGELPLYWSDDPRTGRSLDIDELTVVATGDGVEEYVHADYVDRLRSFLASGPWTTSCYVEGLDGDALCRDFSRTPCGACGTTLGGGRHPAYRYDI